MFDWLAKVVPKRIKQDQLKEIEWEAINLTHARGTLSREVKAVKRERQNLREVLDGALKVVGKEASE